MKYLILSLFVLAAACHDHDENNHHHENNSDNNGHSHSNNNGHGDAGADTAIDVTVDVELTDEVRTYCDCVFLNCHDAYHAKWGADEGVSRQGCLTEAAGVPATGTGDGDHLVCRQSYCDDAKTDELNCDAALGAVTCVP